MANNLFPEGYEEEVLSPEDVEKPFRGYRNGVAFDDEAGDFMRDGKFRMMDSTGIESWKSWCINCIQTERYRHLAYSTDFGIELDQVFEAETREAAESLLTRQITEALLADPYGRCEYVDGIETEWGPDSIAVSVVVHGYDDVTIDITAYLTKGE